MVSVDTPDTSGTVDINADNTVTYTPTPDFNGTDTFTYKTNDGALDSDLATVTITVNPVDVRSPDR